MQLLALIFSIWILYKIRIILDKRPVCQTGLCAEMLASAVQKQKSPLSNQEPFDIQEANNVNLLDDADAKVHDMPEVCCFLCSTIIKIAKKIRKRFTRMVIIIILF